MNRIDIEELWNDATGQFCSEISVDGKRIASVYTPHAELILVNSLADRHCEVWRSLRGRPPQRVVRG
jgi:hypothetical protein